LFISFYFTATTNNNNSSVATYQPPEDSIALQQELHYKDLTRKEDLKDLWPEKFYLFFPIGVTNPIRVYYFSNLIGSVDPSAEVHYCLNKEDTLARGGIVVETIVNSIPTSHQVGNPKREAIKEALYKLIQDKKWLRIRGFNFLARNRSFKLAAIVDQRPWPKPASLFTDQGAPLEIEPAVERKIQLGFDKKVLPYIEHRILDYIQAIKLDGEEHHPYSFWIDLWGEDLLACCEGTQEDQHPRAVGIREWQLQLNRQEEDYKALVRQRLSELSEEEESEEEESEEEQEDLVPNKKRKALA
jgi:hypothetical protein